MNNDRQPPTSRGLQALLALLAVSILAALIGAVLLWRYHSEPAPQPATVVPAASAPAPMAAPASPPEPPVKHPVEAPAAAALLAAADIGSVLEDLLGRKAVLSFFQTENFPRRFVATVDNLGRSHAPPMAWPVNPTPGRFTVEERDGAPVIAIDNSLRYTPLVLLAETVDIGRAVDLYIRMYPLLQQAYVELGYPKRYFNDRLVEVIDILLAAPDVDYPVRLQITEVKGPIPSERPWVRYEYADPALESLPAGQKILLRIGPVNERRLKAKLAEIRQELLKHAPAR